MCTFDLPMNSYRARPKKVPIQNTMSKSRDHGALAFDPSGPSPRGVAKKGVNKAKKEFSRICL